MSVDKFEVGDVVKCVDNGGYSHHLTVGKEYTVIQPFCDNMTIIRNDSWDEACYYSYRFELSDSSPQPPKFKEGDMVYSIGFDCLKPHKLVSTGGDYLTMKFKVKVGDSFRTFTEQGYYTTLDVTPSIVLATDENRKMLNHLFGVEYEPVKLKGSDLARKLLKDKPQTCYMSNISDDIALSNKRIGLIAKFENGSFITMSGVHWEFAVPCDKHGEVLEDE